MEVKYKLLESYFDSKKLSNIKQIYENNEYKKRGEYYEIIISEIDSDIELITDELQKKLVTPFLKTYCSLSATDKSYTCNLPTLVLDTIFIYYVPLKFSLLLLGSSKYLCHMIVILLS